MRNCSQFSPRHRNQAKMCNELNIIKIVCINVPFVAADCRFTDYFIFITGYFCVFLIEARDDANERKGITCTPYLRIVNVLNLLLNVFFREKTKHNSN